MIVVDSSGGQIVGALLEGEEYYRSHHNDLDYDYFPSEDKEGYNSNSFARGLLEAVGLTVPTPTYKTPGWTKPLPQNMFYKKGRWD